MKTCKLCNQAKDLSAFSSSRTNKDGLRSKCKACLVDEVSTRQRTLTGLVKKIYHNQRMTARKMGRPAPAYSETALFNWMLSQGYQSMWEAWSHSNYNKWLSPSIDRIDNTKSYVLDNIQLVTWAENLANQKQQNTDGVYLHSGSKSVDQLDQEGNLLQTFPSAAIAARAIVGHNRNISNITRVCHGKAKSAYGYKWRFTLALC